MTDAKPGIAVYPASVKWFDPQKGYGFVTTPEGEALLHVSVLYAAKVHLPRDAEGLACTVSVQRTGKGLRVTGIEMAEASKKEATP